MIMIRLKHRLPAGLETLTEKTENASTLCLSWRLGKDGEGGCLNSRQLEANSLKPNHQDKATLLSMVHLQS